MKHEESDMQQACIKWFDYQYSNKAILLYAVPNGGSRNVREAVRLRKEGVRRGVADLFLSIPRKGLNGLYLEAKTAKGRQSEFQKNFEKMVIAEGYGYRIFRSLNEFINVVEDYLK